MWLSSARCCPSTAPARRSASLPRTPGATSSGRHPADRDYQGGFAQLPAACVQLTETAVQLTETARPATETARPATETARPATETARPATETAHPATGGVRSRFCHESAPSSAPALAGGFALLLNQCS